MINTMIAYTAGIVDGEGSIQINQTTNNYGKKYWNLTVQVSSNDLNVLTKLKSIWKLGTITKWKAKNNKKNRNSYNWRMYSNEAEIFLNKIKNYLIIKKARAIIALKFRKYVMGGKNTLTPRISLMRNKLAFEIRRLNSINGKGQTSYPKGIK